MIMTVTPPPAVPLDVFEGVVSGLVIAISQVALATCHGYADRDRLAGSIESAIESKPPDLHPEAVKSVLKILADIVRNPGAAPPRWTVQ